MNVLEVSDPKPDDFRCGSQVYNKERLFAFKGKLLIIATPYREGVHVATKPSMFLPIIEQLETLHNKGYVHGDIRAFNCVFGTVKKGWLIDFDFGGKKIDKKPNYPSGYNQLLPDGHRVGKARCEILKKDDWYAMGRLIFDIHFLKQPEDDEVQEGVDETETDELARALRRADRAEFKEKWLRVIEEDELPAQVEHLKIHLKELDAAGWIVKPGDNLAQVVETWNSETERTGPATGSPPKK